MKESIDSDKESEFLDELNHSNIIKFICLDVDKKYFVMEYFKESNLSFFNRGQLSDAEIFSQLIDAVKYIHSKNIVHLDLKLENILLKGNQIILADFGNSQYSKEISDQLIDWVSISFIMGSLIFDAKDQLEIFFKIKNNSFPESTDPTISYIIKRLFCMKDTKDIHDFILLLNYLKKKKSSEKVIEDEKLDFGSFSFFRNLINRWNL